MKEWKKTVHAVPRVLYLNYVCMKLNRYAECKLGTYLSKVRQVLFKVGMGIESNTYPEEFQ